MSTGNTVLPPLPARALRKVLQRVGMHPDDTETVDSFLEGAT